MTSTIIYLKMERYTLANISKYLTEEIIGEVFKFKTKSEDTINTIEVFRAASAGEGLIGAVYRIKVMGNKHKAYFIAKGFVQDALLRMSLRSVLYFKREALFYTEILPDLIEFQAALGAKESIQTILPICYGCHVDGKDDYILMEDLSEKGFTSLSENPTKKERDMTLEVLAHFHSVSLALRLKKPEVFTKITSELNESYYNDGNRDWYASYLQKAIDIDKNILVEIEGTDSIYFKKFKELIQKDVYGLLITLASTRGDHPVINHGDAWCPNFLCREENAVTIDFQMMRCASPATDLSYFIIMLSEYCHNKEAFFEAVKIYYNALKYYLKDMGIEANEVFSLETLQEELKKYGKFGLLAALTSIPLLGSERCDVLKSFEVTYFGFEKIPLEELWQLSPIMSEKYRWQLVNAVRVAVKVGLI